MAVGWVGIIMTALTYTCRLSFFRTDTFTL